MQSRSPTLAILLLATAGSLVDAQDARWPTKRVTGEIHGMQGNALQVVADDGGQFLVQLPQQPQAIVYQGTADPMFLQRGMMVRFSGRFDQRGNSQEAIRRLEVFTPTVPRRRGEVPEEEQVGVFPQAGELDMDHLFRDAPARDAPRETAGSFRVVGQVAQLRQGRLSVVAGRRTVEAVLDDDAEVLIEVHDWRLARPGDTIIAEGWYNPVREALVFANQMTINGAEKLEAERPARSRGGRGPRDAAERRTRPGDRQRDSQPDPFGVDAEFRDDP